MDVMKTAQYWDADGTFDVVNITLFSQLFIIISMSQTGVSVSTLLALLPNEETSSYQRANGGGRDHEMKLYRRGSSSSFYVKV